MTLCPVCGSSTDFLINGTCKKCYEQQKTERILNKSKEVEEPKDFASWDSGDMSELFWIHLGKYQKHPNKHSLNIMEMAFQWACHSNHGIANSFEHALRWAKIDLIDEGDNWDNLPDN